MKKVFLFLCTALVGIISLNSCLEGSNESSGQAVGVYSAYGSKNFSPVFFSTIGNVYAPNMPNNFTDQKCYYIAYSYSADVPENSAAMVELNGYSTITMTAFVPIADYYLKSSLTDTTIVLDNELPLVSGYEAGGSAYVQNYLFMTHVIKIPANTVLNWDMSYNYSTMPTVENDKRYYDLFVRATKTTEGNNTGEVDTSVLNAYYVGSFLQYAAQREMSLLGNSYSAGTSKFTLRINYVSDISEDSKLTWKSATEENLLIYEFLPTTEY